MNIQNPNLQLFTTLLHADFMTKLIIILLIAMSLYSWALIFEKLFKFRLLAIKTSKFEKIFWSGDMLEDIYQKVKNSARCPSVVIFVSAMQEWLNNDIQSIKKNNDNGRKTSLKERLYDVMSVAGSRSIRKIKVGLNFLLVVGSVSTLFGLLGTVWGITSVFKAVSLVKDTTLATIAPGISSSLITTIFGMLTAIPALVAYYVIRGKIRNYEEELNNFSLEILSILSRELD